MDFEKIDTLKQMLEGQEGDITLAKQIIRNQIEEYLTLLGLKLIEDSILVENKEYTFSMYHIRVKDGQNHFIYSNNVAGFSQQEAFEEFKKSFNPSYSLKYPLTVTLTKQK